MKNISFYYEYGNIPEIGTGHFYRYKVLKEELESRNFKESGNSNLVIIDHIFSKKDLINKYKNEGKKIVLIDGAEEDVDLVDLSISAAVNKKSQYRGIDYIIIYTTTKEYINNENNLVFVSVGGFDCNNLTDKIVKVVNDCGFKALTTRKVDDADFFEGMNYYEAMEKCKFAITNGGLTMFQALHYGIPTISIPQYEHQKLNIELIKDNCFKSDIENLKQNIELIKNNIKSYKCIDGLGIKRVCDLIEKICLE